MCKWGRGMDVVGDGLPDDATFVCQVGGGYNNDVLLLVESAEWRDDPDITGRVPEHPGVSFKLR